MKYIKKFENINTLKIGTYVVCNDTELEKGFTEYNSMANFFINNNVGKIIEIQDEEDAPSKKSYLVQYKNIPTKIKNYFHNDKEFRRMNISEILFHSQYEEDAEEFISLYKNQNKYNL